MRQSRAALTVIALNNVLMVLGFRLWQSLFNNFALEELGVRASQIGLIQTVREIPGLLGFLVGLLTLLVVEMRLAGFSVVLMGAGIFMTALSRNLAGLLGATLLMSTGFHFFSSSNSSAVLLTVGPEQAPKMLGRLNSLGAMAALASTLLILGTLDRWGYRPLFQIGGATVVIAGLLLLPFARQPVRVDRSQRRLPMRRRYWLYYVMQFMMGSRRHIFTTFAVILLVRRYGVTAQTITLMFLINNIIGTYFHQAFGKIVARFGERRVLSVNFSLLILIFAGYTVIPRLDALQATTFSLPEVALGGLLLFPSFPATTGLLALLLFFIVDHVLFGFSIAIESYFQKIALGPEEITVNVSRGQTINHVAAVSIPLAGGLIWDTIGAQYTFMIGMLVAVVSLILTQYMQVRRPGAAPDHAARSPGGEEGAGQAPAARLDALLQPVGGETESPSR
ncbi:MAG: MFS transporter [Anaerolineae bacterium]|nr:MFS transporter [Anaerolineae bacterium]